jgi:hypothetical protein
VFVDTESENRRNRRKKKKRQSMSPSRGQTNNAETKDQSERGTEDKYFKRRSRGEAKWHHDLVRPAPSLCPLGLPVEAAETDR